MPSELSIIKGVGLGFMVKRVKGKLYVYEYVRVNGKPIVRYVAPLEVLVRTYEAVQAGITVNQAWKPRTLRRLALYIVDNLMENLRGRWGSGRDLNPGPRGPQPRALPICATGATQPIILWGITG